MERNLKVEIRKIEELFLEIDRIRKGTIQVEKDYRKLNEAFVKSANAERQVLNRLVDCVDDDSMRKKLCAWYDSVSEKQKSMNQAVKAINDVLITSGKKFCSIFNDMYSLNKQREQLTQDVQALENKCHKFETKERTGANLVKVKELKVEIQKLTATLLAMNSAIIEDAESTTGAAQTFFCLPLNSLVQSHLVLFESLHKESQQVCQLFTDEVDLMKLGATPEEHLESRLKDIASELSIVRPDLRDIGDL